MEDISNISQIALEILNLARDITKKRPLNIDSLYQEAKKKLNYLYSDQEINNTIYELLLKKLIIPDKKIVKTQVLANKKRDSIYKYILNHPGTHLREIRDKLNLHPHITNLHLKVLENFEYIYQKKHLKYRVFFPFDFNREYEDVLLSLKNDAAEKLFYTIREKGEMSLDQLKAHFESEISPKMVDYHLDPLKACGLVSSQQRDGQELLTPSEEIFEKIEKYLEETVPITGKLLVKRAYDYIGGDVRFKVVVENKSQEPLRDISVGLDVKEQFTTQNARQTVRLLDPQESRGVDFTLTPLACGKSNIQGVVTYQDSYAHSYSSEIKPVLVQIKCPLVQPRILKLLEVLKMKERFQVSRAAIPYFGLAQNNAFRIARDQIASLDMSEIEAGAEDSTALFSGEAKVTGQPLLVDLHVDSKIGIDVYMGDVKQATGFLAYIKNLISVALNYSLQISTSVEKIKNLIFNGFEFSSRLSELFDFCDQQGSLDDILLLLKELTIKSQSYFQDIKLTDALNARYKELELLQGKELYDRTFLNLQYDVQTWMESIIVFAETNAKIYYESAIDQYTRDEIGMGIFKLKDELNRMAKTYSKRILFTLMLIHKTSGLSLYTHHFSEQEVDSDLISGFLTAIQSFGVEVSKEETRMKRLSYEHFEIELHDGALTVAALTTSGIPNRVTSIALQKFVLRFEAFFKEQIETFTGNVSQFHSAAEMIEELFL
ncbi:MAG: hypothetical protein EU536_04075 [Promethearchaeota archaeon]|nr:MAG: hypothetical protein EU536_04075 [Candidatus Lokiarchaeota archaeon]